MLGALVCGQQPLRWGRWCTMQSAVRILACLLFVLSFTSTSSAQFLVRLYEAAERAPLVEDGLEFVQVHGPWALYEVTDATPRLEFPQIVPADPVDNHHRVRMCVGNRFFNPAGGTGSIAVRLGGNKDGMSTVFRQVAVAAGFLDTACTNNMDALGGFGTDGFVDGIFLDLSPAPPIGSIIALRIVAIGDGPMFADHVGIVPELCCDDPLTCNLSGYCGDNVIDPWEVCDDGLQNGSPGFCQAGCGEPALPICQVSMGRPTRGHVVLVALFPLALVLFRRRWRTG